MKTFRMLFLAVLAGLGLTAFLAKSDYFIKEVIYPESAYVQKVDVYKLTYESDGLKVKGFLLKPKQTNGPLPLLVYNRGGMHDYGAISKKRLAYLSSWANKGYVVVAAQYRGNGGSEGRETYGGGDIHDVINLIRLAEKLPYVDKNKKVAIGYSRGGMMTYLLMKNGIHFDAAAIVSGITDMFQFYEQRGTSVKAELRKMIGNPWTDAGAYKSRSVIYWPEKINSPLLLLHGSNDSKVHHSQAEKLVKQLHRQNKEYKYVLYKGANHPLEQYFHEYNREIERWFAAHLDKKETKP